MNQNDIINQNDIYSICDKIKYCEYNGWLGKSNIDVKINKDNTCNINLKNIALTKYDNIVNYLKCSKLNNIDCYELDEILYQIKQKNNIKYNLNLDNILNPGDIFKFTLSDKIYEFISFNTCTKKYTIKNIDNNQISEINFFNKKYKILVSEISNKTQINYNLDTNIRINDFCFSKIDTNNINKKFNNLKYRIDSKNDYESNSSSYYDYSSDFDTDEESIDSNIEEKINKVNIKETKISLSDLKIKNVDDYTEYFNFSNVNKATTTEIVKEDFPEIVKEDFPEIVKEDFPEIINQNIKYIPKIFEIIPKNEILPYIPNVLKKEKYRPVIIEINKNKNSLDKTNNLILYNKLPVNDPCLVNKNKYIIKKYFNLWKQNMIKSKNNTTKNVNDPCLVNKNQYIIKKYFKLWKQNVTNVKTEKIIENVTNVKTEKIIENVKTEKTSSKCTIM